MKKVHVIPVPKGYTANEAWMEIQVYGRLRMLWWRRWRKVKWAVVVVDERGNIT